jgi:TRAP-type uncharacterized transport system substrate-binding protein
MKSCTRIAVAMLCVFALVFAFTPSAFAKKRVIFGGGPAGGTFQVVANAIQTYKPVKAVKDFTIKAMTSAGSTENLRKTDAGRAATACFPKTKRFTRTSWRWLTCMGRRPSWS